jgi:pimeloyl-ACP methyl ester carboxylesterase
MRESIDRNRRLLEKLCRVGSILGWLLIVLFGLGLGSSIYMALLPTPPAKFSLYNTVTDLVQNYLLASFAVLLVAELLRCLINPERRFGWILRKGYLILGAFACYYFVRWGLFLFYVTASNTLDTVNFVTLLMIGASPALVKTLVLAGAGLALRRVLPIIAESNTLA